MKFSSDLPIGFTKDNTSRNLFRLFQIAFYAVVTVFIINLFSLFSKDASFGIWGDFFGGVLNPILTFLTFMGLLITIILQQTELKQSRKEFQGQKEALENQEFDNKFFQMLNLLNTIISNLQIKNHKGRKVFSYLIGELVRTVKHPKEISYTLEKSYTLEIFNSKFERFNNEYDESFKYYFLNLYQVLNYIDKYSTEEYTLKEYSNIVRAQLSKNELILLFFNAIGIEKFSGSNYKKIIEKYALFEHLTYNDLINYGQNRNENCLSQISELVDIILPTYHKSAFGNNKKFVSKLNKLKKNKKT